MITLGLDPHPGSHTLVALDGNGCLLANITVPNTEAGLKQLHLFAKPFGARRWAIEGAGNHFIATFVTELLAQEETVYSIHRVSPANTDRGEDARKTILWMPLMWLVLYWPTRSFRPCEAGSSNVSCRRCPGHNTAFPSNSSPTGPPWQS